MGCVSEERMQLLSAKLSQVDAAVDLLQSIVHHPREWRERGYVMSLDGTLRSAYDLLSYVPHDRVVFWRVPFAAHALTL